jgi:hypothetical protein
MSFALGGVVLSALCGMGSAFGQAAPQSLPVQDVIANNANSKKLLTSAIESMRSSIPRERLAKVHIKATVAKASTPETVIGDIDATYDSSYYTITHTIAGKRFVTHSVADNVVLPANSEKNVVGESAGTQGQSSTVPGYAAVRLNRHPGLLPLLETWATTDKIAIKSSAKINSEIVGGVPCQFIELYVPRGHLAPLVVHKIFLRDDTGELRAVEFKENIGRVAPIYVSVRLVYDDFANFSGIRTPTKVTRLLDGIPESTFRLTSLELTQ